MRQKLKQTKIIRCPDCFGSGLLGIDPGLNNDSGLNCEECGGKGVIEVEIENDN